MGRRRREFGDGLIVGIILALAIAVVCSWFSIMAGIVPGFFS